MYRSAFRKALGGIAVVGSVAAMSLAGSTAAAASTTTARPVGTESHARSPLGTRSLPDREAGYRGTQGFNLCLLSPAARSGRTTEWAAASDWCRAETCACCRPAK